MLKEKKNDFIYKNVKRFQPRTTISQDVQTRFPVQLAYAKFISKIKGNIWGSAVSMILGTILKISLYSR